MTATVLLLTALLGAADDCVPPIPPDGKVVAAGVAFALPRGFAYSARGAWPAASRPGPAMPGGWIYSASGADGVRVDVTILPGAPISPDDLRAAARSPAPAPGLLPSSPPDVRDTAHGCASMQSGPPQRAFTSSGHDDGPWEASALVSCPGVGVSVRGSAPSTSAVADLIRSVAESVHASTAATPAAHRRDAADRRLVGCYRVSRAGAGTSIRCLDEGGATRSRREEEPTSRPRGPTAPPVDAEWRLGTWQQWNGNVLLCASSELGRTAQYGPLRASSDGWTFRDERWTRVAADDVAPPARVEPRFEPGPGRVDAELPLPAGLTWDDDAETVRRKLSPLLRFVSERRDQARKLVHVYAGTWKGGISSSRIELEFRDGRLSGAALSWDGGEVPSLARRWEELIAAVASEHGAPQGLATVKAVWAEVLKRDVPTARGRALEERRDAGGAPVCVSDAEPAFRKPELPRGGDLYALLDAVVRGDRTDFLVSKWDLVSSWSFRRDAGIVVAMFPVPKEGRPGAAGAVVLLGLSAPR